MENFHKWFKQLRVNAGFSSIRELAAASGVHFSSLARIERGGVTPQADTLKKLAPYLKVPYKTLLEATGYLYGGDKDNEVIIPELPENVLAELEKELSEVQERMDKINSILVKCRKN